MSKMDGVPFRLLLPGHAAVCAGTTKQPGSVGALDYFDLQHLALHHDILQTCPTRKSFTRQQELVRGETRTAHVVPTTVRTQAALI